MKVREQERVDKGMIRVFVYGTLKQAHGNHAIIKNAAGIFLGYDSITGPYRMYDMGYFPAVMDRIDMNHATIRGELWALKPEGLAALDMLEGHPNFYRRRKLWTDDLQRRAWVYMLNDTWEEEVSEDDEVPHYVWHPSPEELQHWKLDDAQPNDK